MRWRVEPGQFALLGFEGELPERVLRGALACEPVQLIREGGETSLLIEEQQARQLAGSLEGARLEAPLAWVRFELAMEWELVGFLAHVTGALAKRGIPLGAVCGYSRDHLFVPLVHLESARAVLGELFGPEQAEPRPAAD